MKLEDKSQQEDITSIDRGDDFSIELTPDQIEILKRKDLLEILREANMHAQNVLSIVEGWGEELRKAHTK